LACPDDTITEPVVLPRILAAEQRLVAAAGRTDVRVVDVGTVESPQPTG
jgi:hypothetical protein